MFTRNVRPILRQSDLARNTRCIHNTPSLPSLCGHFHVWNFGSHTVQHAVQVYTNYEIPIMVIYVFDICNADLLPDDLEI